MVCMHARMTRLGGHARVELYLLGTGVKDGGRLIDRPLCVQRSTGWCPLWGRGAGLHGRDETLDTREGTRSERDPIWISFLRFR